MRSHVVRLVLILLVAWGGVGLATAEGLAPKLGLDLQGGISVILTAPEGTAPDVLETAVEVMRNRIESLGDVQEPEISISGDRNVLVQLPGITNQEDALGVIGQTGQLSFRPVCDVRNDIESAFETPAVPDACDNIEEVAVDSVTGLATSDDLTKAAWLPEYDNDGAVVAEYLVGPAEVLGTDVEDSVPQIDPTGQWAVSLVFDSRGADQFAQLTADAAGFSDPVHRRVAIVLDGEVITAPQVNTGVDPNQGITGGTAQITMGATSVDAQREAEDLSIVLRYGSLPVELERSQLQKVSATLGSESLQTGILAGAVGLALVAMVLIGYYRSLGVVAVVGLSVFGSLLLLIYSLLGEFNGLNLTLAGVTGMIVSIGITTDSYIVYFERIKEELRRGHTMSDALELGFSKAFRTILTADTVSLMGAVLLYILAIGPVKGFALALGIATVLDIIVARLYTRNAVALIGTSGLGEGGVVSIRGASGVPV